jgi:hypothetical protein
MAAFFICAEFFQAKHEGSKSQRSQKNICVTL